jgi:hypothetical protein
MERRFTPQEKKRNRYDRDHVTLGWKTGTKYRKKRRLKKALAERSLRRESSVATHGLLRDAEGEIARSAKPRRVTTGAPPTVRDLIEHKMRRREGSHGAKAERRARYSGWADQAIESFLKQMVRRRRIDDLARLRDLRSLVRSEIDHPFVSDGELARFFRRHPVWMTRLRPWRNGIWSRVRSGKQRRP